METGVSTVLFVLGLVASAGIVLYAISRGGPRGVPRPDPYRTALHQLVHNEPEAALESLRQLIQSGKAPPDAYIKMGELLRRRGDAMAAFRIHQSLTVRGDLTLDERAANLHSLVEDYRALGQRGEALRTLEELAGLRRDADVQRELAREALWAGQYDAAALHMRELHKQDARVGGPEAAAFLAVVAERCLQHGRPQDARRFLTQALKEDDECAPALLAMGEIEAQDGDLDNALFYWQKLAILGAPPGSGVHERLERVYFELGKFGDIERVYAQILEKRPRDVETLLAAARIAVKKGENAEAERLLRAALDVAPDSSAAFSMLSGIYMDAGRTRELRELLAAHVAQHRDGGTLACPACGARRERPSGYCADCGRFGAFTRA